MIEMGIVFCFFSLVYMTIHAFLGHVTMSVINIMTFDKFNEVILKKIGDIFFLLGFINISLWTFGVIFYRLS